MKKIVAYAARPDEMNAFKKFQNELDLEITYVNQILDVESAKQSEGFEAVTILGSNTADREVLKALHDHGVKYLALRSSGYNNVDMAAAKEYGIRFSNAVYAPNSVADYTTMLILMSIRKMKQIMIRNTAQDYTVAGNQGKVIKDLKIGIVGTGRIGATVARNLSGFGCEILGCDVYENQDLLDILSYAPLEELFETCDVITLHAPLLDTNYHMIDDAAISKMKDGVVIVNCSRGELIDTNALISHIESGKVGAAALDVIEGELSIFHQDHRQNILSNHQFSILQQFPNVIVTPHTAFYTDQAVNGMVEVALRSLISFMDEGKSDWEIKL
ncbi:D-isomer specific 2-hydroxyacid dehydrogenase family protein [Paenibacillus sp. Aloe-11]|uniref:D-isomer specific 2-hydroxyacid dehydrogenase family protein n=1 Tax=Paenibacillus sp. Aloe-11 TaxID=1050222 RepID=UPI00024F022A|nr:D-isomer specific 2-hydroxyacid dehydrogenase family protein [Paenibacillus sp. Aloe-11]EHS59223.1 D-lactate dehydrogenase [Paenibacillus sp. Aloe-11]